MMTVFITDCGTYAIAHALKTCRDRLSVNIESDVFLPVAAVDIVVPPGRYDYKPSFEFSVSVNSSAALVNSAGMSTDYRIDALMSCTPDPISLWCCFKKDEFTHGQKLLNYSSKTIVPPSGLMSDMTSITDEKFLLEFDKTGVKISSCNETSERSLRMVQSIVDLLNVDIDFDGERRGASRLETITVDNDCPLTTKASYRPIGKNTKKPGEGFFKLMSHPDEFDETTEWILEVNKTRDIKNCKNVHGYFFGSVGDNDTLHGSKLESNVVSILRGFVFTFDFSSNPSVIFVVALVADFDGEQHQNNEREFRFYRLHRGNDDFAHHEVRRQGRHHCVHQSRQREGSEVSKEFAEKRKQKRFN